MYGLHHLFAFSFVSFLLRLHIIIYFHFMQVFIFIFFYSFSFLALINSDKIIFVQIEQFSIVMYNKTTKINVDEKNN